MKKTYLKVIFYAIIVSIYVLAISIVHYCAKTYKTGPCTPNFDMLSGMLALLISLVCFIVSIVKAIKGNKMAWLTAGIHLLGFAAIIYFS